jgi:predicted ATPase
MAELVSQLGSSGPLLIVLEDLHWADAMSARLLAFLGRRLGNLPVLVAGTTRPEDLVDAPVLEQALAELRAGGTLDEVRLGPLSREEALALARSLRPGGRDRHGVDRIADDLWALSEGNPFVIVEAVRGLAERGPDESGSRPLLSRSVRESITARLARLPELSRRAVAVAAVINRAFSFQLLHHAAGLEEAEAARAVEELVRRRVLDTVGDRLDFCHDRIRQVAYEEIIPAQRAPLHGGVARALAAGHAGELDEIADRLGHHYIRAGEVERALPHVTGPARRAVIARGPARISSTRSRRWRRRRRPGAPPRPACSRVRSTSRCPTPWPDRRRARCGFYIAEKIFSGLVRPPLDR